MTKSGNKKSLFWTSYSDLMTSLFFAMLVLFVVVVVAMGTVNKQLKDALNRAEITIEQQNQVLKLQEQFQTLAGSTSLDYDEEKRMFYAKDFVGIEIFKPNEAEIKQEFLSKVDEVGSDIKNIIDSLNRRSGRFKYQLVIEGTAAIPYKEKIAKTFNPNNYEMFLLSYRRALALYKRWEYLNFPKSNTEVIIAGSGFNGKNRDDIIEENNKRFVIQIIPKIDRPTDK